jgi:RNA polymerase sigma-70 factor, ECF subfamily
MSQTLTLLQVVNRVQSGDRAAFEQLYRLCKGRVYNLCSRMVGNVAQAEELTQETFLQVYRRIDTYRGESSFTTWLHRVTVNVVLMNVRRKTIPMASLESMTKPDWKESPPFQPGIDDRQLRGTLDRVHLEHAIRQLPPGYKIVFILHDIEGYEHNEVAELLGCTIGNSKSQLHKARLRLRFLLNGEQKQQREQAELA